MKRLGVAVLIAAIIGSVWYLQQSTPKTSAATAQPAPVERPTPTAAPIGKVTRLGSIEERKLLAERIEKARALRSKSSSTGTLATATSAPAAPRLPEQATPISAVEIRTAMREVIPILAECYEVALPSLPDPHVEITAEMTLTGDPDVGTVIDAKQVTDKAGQPLPAKFDDCLRSTFQTLALPPLTEGDEVDVRYPFVFDNR